MNKHEWQKAFGETPESFRDQLRSTLNDLEDKNMKKRYKISTMLAAALIAALLIVGAGLASGKLGVFKILNRIEPLDGAEEMVAVNLGSVENDLVTLSVEEAVYDGYGAILKLRIAPKDTEKHALYAAMLQDAPEDIYNVESVPVEVGNGEVFITTDEGEVIEIPTYEKDGKLYYEDQYEFRVLGRKDGRKMINYWPRISESDGRTFQDEEWGTGTFFDTMDAEEQPDGSVIVWCEATGAENARPDQMDISVSARITLDGEEVPIESIPVRLVNAEQERTVTLEPVGDGQGEGFKILSGEISFTRLKAYFKLDYVDQSNVIYGTSVRLYDAEDNEIYTGSGWTREIGRDAENPINHAVMEMQSLEEIPESIWVEIKAIDDKPLGRVECRVVDDKKA